MDNSSLSRHPSTRLRNSARSTIFGLILKIVTLLIPFFVRTVFIRVLGMEYLGLNTLFTSVLNVINLAELGIDSAVVFMLYKPIANNDEQLISQMCNFLRKAYFIIGGITFGAGAAVMPFLKFLIKGDAPPGINLYIVYSIQLLNALIPYFVFSYKRTLLQGFQRGDVNSKIGTLVILTQFGLQLFLLVLFKNYYVYIVVVPFCTALSAIIVELTTNKMYPTLKARGRLPKEETKAIFGKVKALFLYRVGSIVLTSVDGIVISAFLGLYELGRYNSYYYVISTLFGFIAVLTNALLPSVGNSVAMETPEKNKKDFDRFFFFLKWFVSWCTVCLFCLYQHFISLWVGANNLYPLGVIACLGVYFYFWKMMEAVNLYKDAAGLWNYDRFRPLISAAVNLALNLVLVNFIGIYGILLSTIVSILFIIFPWSSVVVFKHYFKNGLKTYLIEYFLNVLVTALACSVTYGICLLIPQYSLGVFAIQCAICLVVPNLVLLSCYSWTHQFWETIVWLLSKIQKGKTKS